MIRIDFKSIRVEKAALAVTIPFMSLFEFVHSKTSLPLPHASYIFHGSEPLNQAVLHDLIIAENNRRL